MNRVGSGSALDYLLERFPDIISSGDLYLRVENGNGYWYFSKYGAQRILQHASNAAAFGVIQTVPQAQNPLNSNTKKYFIDYFDQFIKVFAPESTTLSSPKIGIPNCNSNYSPNC
jgi:hypothetical protein